MRRWKGAGRSDRLHENGGTCAYGSPSSRHTVRPARSLAVRIWLADSWAVVSVDEIMEVTNEIRKMPNSTCAQVCGWGEGVGRG